MPASGCGSCPLLCIRVCSGKQYPGCCNSLYAAPLQVGMCCALLHSVRPQWSSTHHHASCKALGAYRQMGNGQSMLGGPSPSLKTLTIASKNSRTRPHLKSRSKQSAYRSVCIHKQYLHIRRDKVYEKFAAAGSRGPWRRLSSWATLTMADTDEELVRKLHLEINGLSRPRRARVVHEVPGTHTVSASGCTMRSPRRLRPAQSLYVCIFTVLSMQASSSYLAICK